MLCMRNCNFMLTVCQRYAGETLIQYYNYIYSDFHNATPEISCMEYVECTLVDCVLPL